MLTFLFLKGKNIVKTPYMCIKYLWKMKLSLVADGTGSGIGKKLLFIE